jgi:formylmethanofuran dehydrogenase subunit B
VTTNNLYKQKTTQAELLLGSDNRQHMPHQNTHLLRGLP